MLSKGIGKKAFTNNPYLGFVLENEENAIADELFMVGLAYHNGWFMLPQDDKKAVAYFRRAAEKGHATAQLTMMRVAMRYPDDTNEEAISWLLKAAEQGEPQAMYNLGISYHRGDIGGKPDIGKSNELIRRAAEFGYHAAFLRMAAIYANGDGVERNMRIAKYWAWLDFLKLSEDEKKQSPLFQFLEHDDISDDPKSGKKIIQGGIIIEKASEAGERDATNTIAGETLKKGDKEKAIQLFEKVARLGHSNALDNLARIYWHEDEKNYTEIKSLLERSAASCNVKAYYDLAALYCLGLGVEKDMAKAWSYLEKGINMGNKECRKLFSDMLVKNELDDIIPPITGRAMNYMELASMDGYAPKV